MKMTQHLIAVFLGLLVAGASMAGGNSSGLYDTIGEDVAIGGYDPVAYFLDGGGKPEKGFVLRNYTHKGITYRFASDANLAAFKANPDKYLPVYGGWCAWAIAKLGKKVDVDPESYVIRDGKLYLFYNQKELDTRKDWSTDPEDFIAKGQANWAKLTQ